MPPTSNVSAHCRVVAAGFAGVYMIIQIFRIQAATQGTWQRSWRDLSRVRLPNLYLCPAGAAKRDALVRWAAYNCSLRYRKEQKSCYAQERSYDGYPEDFGMGSGRCLEFLSSNLLIGQEWTPAWNELTLYAAWEELTGKVNDLQEVELGYRPSEWELEEPADKDRFYYPILRLPTFELPLTKPADGVATRAFLGEEKDMGRRYAGKYWYVYGSTFPVMRNPSLPSQRLVGPSSIDNVDIGAPGERGPVKVVAARIILTLEDFALYIEEYVQQPLIYPLVAVIGELAGVATLLLALTHRFSNHDDETEVSQARNIKNPDYLELATAEGEDYRNEHSPHDGSRQGLLDTGACSDSEKVE